MCESECVCLSVWVFVVCCSFSLVSSSQLPRHRLSKFYFFVLVICVVCLWRRLSSKIFAFNIATHNDVSAKPNKCRSFPSRSIFHRFPFGMKVKWHFVGLNYVLWIFIGRKMAAVEYLRYRSVGERKRIKHTNTQKLFKCTAHTRGADKTNRHTTYVYVPSAVHIFFSHPFVDSFGWTRIIHTQSIITDVKTCKMN